MTDTDTKLTTLRRTVLKGIGTTAGVGGLASSAGMAEETKNTVHHLDVGIVHDVAFEETDQYHYQMIEVDAPRGHRVHHSENEIILISALLTESDETLYKNENAVFWDGAYAAVPNVILGSQSVGSIVTDTLDGFQPTKHLRLAQDHQPSKVLVELDQRTAILSTEGTSNKVRVGESKTFALPTRVVVASVRDSSGNRDSKEVKATPYVTISNFGTRNVKKRDYK